MSAKQHVPKTPRAAPPGGQAAATAGQSAGNGASRAQLERSLATARQSPARPLPHRARLQASFGRDLGGVLAHYDDEDTKVLLSSAGVPAACEGAHVWFENAQPTLEIAAHEVAHALQAVEASAPRADAGAAEQDADAAADAAVRGEEAEVGVSSEGGAAGWGLGDLFDSVASTVSSVASAVTSTVSSAASATVDFVQGAGAAVASEGVAVPTAVVAPASGPAESSRRVGSAVSAAPTAANIGIADQAVSEPKMDLSIAGIVSALQHSGGGELVDRGAIKAAAAEVSAFTMEFLHQGFVEFPAEMWEVATDIVELAVDVDIAARNTRAQAGRSIDDVATVAGHGLAETSTDAWLGLLDVGNAAWSWARDTGSALIDEEGTLAALEDGWSDVKSATVSALMTGDFVGVVVAGWSATTETASALVDEQGTVEAASAGFAELVDTAGEELAEVRESASEGFAETKTVALSGAADTLEEFVGQFLIVGGERLSALSEEYPVVGDGLARILETIDHLRPKEGEEASDAKEGARDEPATHLVPGAECTILVLSGQNTTQDALQDMVDQTAVKTQCNVYAPANPSFGNVSDTGQSFQLMDSGAGDAQVNEAAQYILDAVTAGEICPIIAHSQGSLVAAGAIAQVRADLIAMAMSDGSDAHAAAAAADAQLAKYVKVLAFGSAASEADYPGTMAGSGNLTIKNGDHDPIPMLSGGTTVTLGTDLAFGDHAYDAYLKAYSGDVDAFVAAIQPGEADAEGVD